MSDQKKSSPPVLENENSNANSNEVSMTRDELIYEIQSSVDIIVGFAGVLKEQGLSLKDQHRFLEIIERNARKITSLIITK